jgi:hypothetical protein
MVGGYWVKKGGEEPRKLFLSQRRTKHFFPSYLSFFLEAVEGYGLICPDGRSYIIPWMLSMEEPGDYSKVIFAGLPM